MLTLAGEFVAGCGWMVRLAASPWVLAAWGATAIVFSARIKAQQAASERALEAMVENVVRRQMGLPEDPRHPPAPPPGSEIYRGGKRSGN
jgi:hypothetical protein